MDLSARLALSIFMVKNQTWRDMGKKNKKTENVRKPFTLSSSLFYGISGILAVAAFLLVMSATSLYGPGMTSDSVSYLSTARNIGSGEGFQLWDGTAYTKWPPFYPILMSISAVFGGEVTGFARVLNGLLFAAIVYLFILIAEKSLRSRSYALIAGVIMLFSTATLNTSIMVWSEPLFTALILAAALFARKYRDDGDMTSFFLFTLFSALSALTRYSGVAVIGSGLIFIALLRHKNWSCRLKFGLLYGALSSLPLGVWLIRNRLVTGSMAGARPASDLNLLENIMQTLKVMGFSLFNLRENVAIIFFVLVLAFAAYTGWRVIGRKKSIPFILILPIGYIAFLVLTASLIRFDVINDRLLAPVLPFAILLFVRAILIGGEKLKGGVRALLLLPLFIWFMVMAINTASFVNNAKRRGAGHYNSDMFRNSALVRQLMYKPLSGVVYSNFPDLLYILTDMDVRWAPFKDGKWPEMDDNIRDGETVQIAWFFYERASVKKLGEIIDPSRVNLLHRYPDGWIGTYTKKVEPAVSDTTK